MKEVEINVCGKSIKIVPTAVVVRVEKMNDKYVYLILTGQGGQVITKTINAIDKYGVNADTFIKEFNNQCGLEFTKALNESEIELGANGLPPTYLG
jgi:hypothetical protein